MEKNTPFSQRAGYTPTPFTKFLWWLSTAEEEILADSVVDRNRYSIIGLTVLGTWLFATLAWTYFFSTVVDSIIAFTLCGLFMGFIILCIDRALIKGITKFNKRRFTPLLFRGLLAATIGTFMAQPAVLYIFDKEIKMQTSIDNEARKITKRATLDSLYGNRKVLLNNERTTIENELSRNYENVNIARNNYLAETDGSGGTGKVGIKDIALAKKNEYEKLDAEYKLLSAQRKPQLDSIHASLANMDASIAKEEALFATYLNDGFLTRAEALNNLLKNSAPLQARYWLIVAILILIELMPVIAKTLLPSGSYDEKARLREQLETEIAQLNINSEKELKEEYIKMALAFDRSSIEELFNMSKAARKEKLVAMQKKWAEEGESFDNMWDRMKKDVISKQEN